MSDKKNIDRLFQERFKDFDVTPNDTVWKKIQAQKNKNRKRALVIPFWYRIAGVAALVTIIVSLGSILYPDNTITNTIVTTEDPENKLDIKNNTTITLKIPEKENNQYKSPKTETTITTNERITDNLKDQNTQNSFLDVTKDHSSTKKQLNIPINNTTNVASNNTIKEEDNPSKYATKIDDKQDNTTLIKNKESTTIAVDFSKLKGLESKNSDIDPLKDTSKEIEKGSKEFKNNISKSEAIAGNAEIHNNQKKKEVSKEISDQNNNGKKSILKTIEEQKKKETIVAETDSRKKWNIAPNVAPIYYDSFSGSSIDQEFSDNNKQGLVNLSYGVQVAYSVTKKLIVRSGVNKIDVGYNTEDVGFGVASVARTSNGANLSNTQNIVVSDFKDTPVGTSFAQNENNSILVQSKNPGLLNHSIGYIEVPLELKYEITNSKIGVHMIGGVSTLFLENEEVAIVAGSFINENVVRDQTVNDISFSGNVGLGFDYKLSEQFQINMEPIFKYQFNGFKNNAESFKPYSFGIYTGINFKF